MVSHDRSFLNAISDEIILIKNKTLRYYTGNYDAYLKVSFALIGQDNFRFKEKDGSNTGRIRQEERSHKEFNRELKEAKC